MSPKNDLQTDLRDFKNFSLDAFERDINAVDWSFDTDLSLKLFLVLVCRVLDKYFPLKK